MWHQNSCKRVERDELRSNKEELKKTEPRAKSQKTSKTIAMRAEDRTSKAQGKEKGRAIKEKSKHTIDSQLCTF